MKCVKEYRDKNNNVIKAGMTIRHDDGQEEVVVACGEDNLGVNATNYNSSTWTQHLAYPLSEFNLREWEIVL